MLTAHWPLLEVDALSVKFPVAGALFGAKRWLHALSDVHLQLRKGEILGLVGESGSGKSTLGRAIILPQENISGGCIRFEGRPITGGLRSDMAHMRQQMAMVFQDPFASLNPRQTIGESIAEVLRVHRKVPKDRIPARVDELLAEVGLRPEHGKRRPHALSGGQCQRAGIARALAIDPQLIVADECVSALDVSIQGQIINLLMTLREKKGLTILFIAHDLAIVRRLCDRVAVMYLGRIVEEGPVEVVFSQPRHPYTAALIAAIPEIDPHKTLADSALAGEPPSPIARPAGCAFHPRCPVAQAQCRSGSAPETRHFADHGYACVLDRSGGEFVNQGVVK
ncbi:peptide/nickel transport system ATP-binding protein [Rhodoferax sp. OV413]|uniref:ABC transporter ATP-binding protein n=1 Tax=Rhodoferax sp. OV413 TaxID=1855285 RepID=UPI000883953D|nr:ABC transporter ATP-binding protein [Rhodoferax sp. OV413]SDP11765.1 peptide/nickel transport system ATP-binding protein [Rhodoferax sp. OV413]